MQRVVFKTLAFAFTHPLMAAGLAFFAHQAYKSLTTKKNHQCCGCGRRDRTW